MDETMGIDAEAALNENILKTVKTEYNVIDLFIHIILHNKL